VSSTHYIMKHILPALKAKYTDAKYHVYNIQPSSDFYFRIASPRVATSTTLMPAEKIFGAMSEAYKAYSADDFTFIQAFATGLDTDARKLTYQRGEQQPEELPYHALMIATGSTTHYPAFSQPSTKEATLEAIKTTNTQAAAAKDIIIVGGGPTAVEFAGELAEFRNGRPGWFSPAPRKVNITLITAATQLLPTLRAPIAQTAANKLKDLGVEILFETRVTNVSEAQDGRKTVHLANGRELAADLYIPAHGVTPNSSWLPTNLLNEHKYLITNPQTLRVDTAGPRVYALGDISSASRNTVMDILDMLPVALVNVKRDLVSFDPASPTKPAPGEDRIFTPQKVISMVTPIGTRGGVAQIMGWSAPSWAVWLVKGRDYMVGMSMWQMLRGETMAKEYKFRVAEAVF
jgi:NADH dehydrogenase FAD-containing subunit